MPESTVKGRTVMTQVKLSCECGEVKGTLEIVKGHFFHVECLCKDCQAFVKHLNAQEKILDKHGGTELFQTYPAYLNITQGQDNIACLQLSAKGIYRWHTTCCHVPVANTLRAAGFPFVGVSVKMMQFADEQEKQNTLGPLTVKAFGKYAIGDMPKDAHETYPPSFMFKMMGFMLKGKLGRKNQPSVFFPNGKPLRLPKMVAN